MSEYAPKAMHDFRQYVLDKTCSSLGLCFYDHDKPLNPQGFSLIGLGAARPHKAIASVAHLYICVAGELARLED